MNREQYDVGDVIQISSNEDYAVIISQRDTGYNDILSTIKVLSTGTSFAVYLKTSKIIIKKAPLEIFK